jgi:hypothetical protein
MSETKLSFDSVSITNNRESTSITFSSNPGQSNGDLLGAQGTAHLSLNLNKDHKVKVDLNKDYDVILVERKPANQ